MTGLCSLPKGVQKLPWQGGPRDKVLKKKTVCERQSNDKKRTAANNGRPSGSGRVESPRDGEQEERSPYEGGRRAFRNSRPLFGSPGTQKGITHVDPSTTRLHRHVEKKKCRGSK